MSLRQILAQEGLTASRYEVGGTAQIGDEVFIITEAMGPSKFQGVLSKWSPRGRSPAPGSRPQPINVKDVDEFLDKDMGLVR